jgi:hypothetical protein
MPLTTAMIARAIPAAIRPYSIAVAPDRSATNSKNVRFKIASSSQRCLVLRAFHKENLTNKISRFSELR